MKVRLTVSLDCEFEAPELVKVNAYKGEFRLSLYLLFLPCQRVHGRTAAFSAKRGKLFIPTPLISSSDLLAQYLLYQ